MACLETTFVIDLLQGKADILELKNEIDKTESIVSVAAPSVMEVWTGASQSNLPKKEKATINELLSSRVVLALDERSGRNRIKAPEIRHNYRC